MESSSKIVLIEKIERQLITIKTDLVNLSFVIEAMQDKNIQKILQHAFVLTAYGYLEGFYKNTLTEYLHYIQKYKETHKNSQLSTTLYYFYRFSEKSKRNREFGKNVVAYFKKIFRDKKIIQQDKSADSDLTLSSFVINCNNNMKYDILLLLLHLFSFNLKNYEEFEDINKKKYSTESYLNDFVDDRNALAHGEIGCLLGTFNLRNDYKQYKDLVVYLSDCLKNEITEILLNDSYIFV